MARARFTREGHRFVVTENTCRVYERIEDDYGSTERVVSPQKRVGMTRKYADDVETARNTLNG